MDDQTLLNLLQTDAENGMRQVIRIYGPAVHKICVSILAGRPREELEEAEADVFVRIWKYRERIRLSETYPLKSYLFAIARNVSKDKLHRTRPDTLSLDAALEDGIEPEAPDNTEEAAAESWLKDAVAEAVAKLDGGYSVKEIASHLGLPEKKVENILHRDRAKLHALLAEKGVTSYEEFGK